MYLFTFYFRSDNEKFTIRPIRERDINFPCSQTVINYVRNLTGLRRNRGLKPPTPFRIYSCVSWVWRGDGRKVCHRW